MTDGTTDHTRPGEPFTFEVDDEPIETNEHVLPAAEILRLADRDPADFDLRRIRGGPKETLHDDEEVRINSGLAFVTISTGPTPVA